MWTWSILLKSTITERKKNTKDTKYQSVGKDETKNREESGFMCSKYTFEWVFFIILNDPTMFVFIAMLNTPDGLKCRL